MMTLLSGFRNLTLRRTNHHGNTNITMLKVKFPLELKKKMRLR